MASPQELKRYRRNLADELDSAAVYDTLSAAEKDARRSAISEARKQSSGRGSDAEQIKPKKRRADVSAPAADDGSEVGRRVGRSIGNIKRAKKRQTSSKRAHQGSK